MNLLWFTNIGLKGGSMRGITCSDGDVRRRCHVMSKAEGGFVCVVV